MPSCFVIQPFDSGKFDKRFDDVYQPAIEAAELEAYRVDRDPGVEVPIEAIEDGIRDAAICLADITTDNPNVWYELGFAIASGRPVVMVCSSERLNQRFPFDIQHRSIITYKTESSSDFDSLKNNITGRLQALLNKTETLRQIEESEQVAPTEGLSAPEQMALAILAANAGLPGSNTSVYSLKRDVERAGLTAIGFSLAFRRLLAKGFVEHGTAQDQQGEEYEAAWLTTDAWKWIERNEGLFVIRRKEKAPTSLLQEDDEIPF